MRKVKLETLIKRFINYYTTETQVLRNILAIYLDFDISDLGIPASYGASQKNKKPMTVVVVSH